MANTVTKSDQEELVLDDYQDIFADELPLNLTDPSQIHAKRFTDLLISIFVLVFILTWLFPIVALLIKLTSKGPVFFKQIRHGQDNTLFCCYKFRTMIVNGEADIRQATKNDSRVTRVGAFLRRTSLDELPQVVNVLRGEMSIVGPRPHPVRLNEYFSKNIQNYMCRHIVKPGITGLAQAKGFRGETKDYHQMNSRYRLDLFYVKNWSIWLDLKIIIWTFISLVNNKGEVY